jgi:hypothetical protein
MGQRALRPPATLGPSPQMRMCVSVDIGCENVYSWPDKGMHRRLSLRNYDKAWLTDSAATAPEV